MPRPFGCKPYRRWSACYKPRSLPFLRNQSDLLATSAFIDALQMVAVGERLKKMYGVGEGVFGIGRRSVLRMLFEEFEGGTWGFPLVTNAETRTAVRSVVSGP
jgi:hypothetical protein